MTITSTRLILLRFEECFFLNYFQKSLEHSFKDLFCNDLECFHSKNHSKYNVVFINTTSFILIIDIINEQTNMHHPIIYFRTL